MNPTFHDAGSQYESSLKNIIDQSSLKWIFVGGKGGVGKTTVSCSLAIQLAQVREKVLIISTDPAHNLSDAFNQQFSYTPRVVNGYSNLYAMETDTISGFNGVPELLYEELPSGGGFNIADFIQEVLAVFPDMQEVVNYNAMLHSVNGMGFSTVVFDTAPTGHTLRLLKLPNLFEKSIETVLSLTPIINVLNTFVSTLNSVLERFFIRLQELRDTTRGLNAQFKDPERTTFVSVCMADILSLYETERLIQKLFDLEIHTDNIVVNQLLTNNVSSCSQCSTRIDKQNQYLRQIDDLYGDFHITKLPLIGNEVRGTEQLAAFSRRLIGESDS